MELTERDPISDLKRLKRNVMHLSEYGVRLAADDVGAGNAGLRLLTELPFDIVKTISRSSRKRRATPRPGQCSAP